MDIFFAGGAKKTMVIPFYIRDILYFSRLWRENFFRGVSGSEVGYTGFLAKKRGSPVKGYTGSPEAVENHGYGTTKYRDILSP